MTVALVVVAALILGGAALVIARYVDPAWVISAGLALSVFSGNWGYIGVPIGIDRLVVLAGVAAFVVQCARTRSFPLKLGAVHGVMAVLLVYGIGSAVFAGTIGEKASVFGLLDKLGVVPLLLFAAAPAVFATAKSRRALLIVLVVLGAYLGLTSTLETIGLRALVFPRYIVNPELGIHAERARGPFLESAANGQALYVCAVGAAIFIVVSHGRLWRVFAAVVIVLCAIGIVGTLTRQIWLASAVATFVALASKASLRRYIVPAAVAGALLVGALFVAVPSLQSNAEERAGVERPVWDRLNSNRAALNMLDSRPLVGYGWGRFGAVSDDFYDLSDDYPVTTVGAVHNVFLSNAAELGLVGVSLFVATLIMAFAPLARSRPRGEPDLWRTGAIAVLAGWLVVVNFAPFAYAFSNYSMWLVLGVASGAALRDPKASMAHRDEWSLVRRRTPITPAAS